MSQKLRYIQQVINNSGVQDTDPALFQALTEIAKLSDTSVNASDRLVAGGSQFVLDENSGLYLEVAQSGAAQFPFRVNNSGFITGTMDASSLISGTLPNARTAQHTTYTPSLQCATGTPVVGSGGSLTGEWYRVGQLIFARAQWTLGTGFSFGSGGTFGISLPIAPRYAIIPVQAEAIDVGVNGFRVLGLYALVNGVNTMALFKFQEQRANISATVPFTWVAGDNLNFSTIYATSF